MNDGSFIFSVSILPANHYSHVVSLPIESPFLKTEGEPVMVNLPSYQDMLGDKLTAFAPHTTGIPFFKGDKDCSMEITKFNKFKKSNIEAFFYWNEIQKLSNCNTSLYYLFKFRK